MIKESDIVYGTIIQDEQGLMCKITGGTTINNQKCYIVQPLIAETVVLKDYIENRWKIVKDNPLGIPIGFDEIYE